MRDERCVEFEFDSERTTVAKATAGRDCNEHPAIFSRANCSAIFVGFSDVNRGCSVRPKSGLPAPSYDVVNPRRPKTVPTHRD